ncbi:MAG TPA: phosphoglucosamine mutase [Terriglobales bacterium]|nr:phosphoglucosamine mutase [Terriglobales bacterium]
MKLLKIGISGVRGIVGETMTPEVVMDFACAFGTFVGGGRILVGRDTRPSGPMIQRAVLASLASTGCRPLDMGVCPTPVLQKSVTAARAAGAVSITAGHNTAEWNALTFINGNGTYLDEFQGQAVLDIYHLEKFRKAPLSRLGRVKPAGCGLEGYLEALGRFLDLAAIRRRGFKVVIDPCNGAGAGAVDELCRALGCGLVPVNDEPTGYFVHEPEPRPRNAGEVASLVKVSGADAGFLLNSDASRVSVVAEDGETLSEEYALPLVADHYLRRDPGTVVTNSSSSRMIEDVAARHGVRVVKARVGQSHVVQTLLAEEGSMAGEGSGSVAVRRFQPAYDAFLAMGLLLEAMAAGGRRMSELAAALPKYHIVKEKVYCQPSRIHSVVAETRKLFPDHEILAVDGIKAERKEGWVHVRASATEPMIRIIAENASAERARDDVDRVTAFVSQLV